MWVNWPEGQLVRSIRKIIALEFLLTSWAVAQTDSPLEGVVTTNHGEPVAGVYVYGSKSKICCPYKSENTTTNEKGLFHLDHPGAVVHFSNESFEPRAVVLQPDSGPVQITLSTLGQDFTVPGCGAHRPGTKRIGWQVRFDVPRRRSVKILGGKTDVDYVRYLIKPKMGESYLELWFGPYAIDSEPGDEDFVNSTNYSQRRIVIPGVGTAGTDSQGQLRSQVTWRQTVIVGAGGSRYRATTPQDVVLFNQIVETMCRAVFQDKSGKADKPQPKP
jgi:hypothetical protein